MTVSDAEETAQAPWADVPKTERELQNAWAVDHVARIASRIEATSQYLTESDRRFWTKLEEIRQRRDMFELDLGALGARLGLTAESAFRKALKAVLEDSFGVQVINWRKKDTEGVVRGYPAEVELDLIIHNGTLIIMEIKSSMSQSDLDKFLRAALFYQEVNSVKADRLIVISPMVSAGAAARAQETGIELYGYPADIDPRSLQGKGQDA